MTIATVTPTTVASATAPVATAVEHFDNTVTANALATFRYAIALVDNDTANSDASTATLQALTLERYAFHAHRYSESRGGLNVVPADMRKAVTTRVWRDAGHDTAPTVLERAASRGLKSVGEYLSRMTRVATNLDYGVDALETVETMADALELIREDSKESKATVKRIEEHAQHVAFTTWLNALKSNDRAAIKRTVELFTDNAEQLPAFIAKLSGIAPVAPVESDPADNS